MHARVLITLLADRFKPGRFQFFDADGAHLFSCLCLGRSAGVLDRLTGAVRRDPLAYRGNTPTGDYALTGVVRLPKPVLGIGSLWVPLDPVAGQALEAEKRGRDGLGIHGGRGNGALKPTHGCIRLLDADMAVFAQRAGKTRFTVTVQEISR